MATLLALTAPLSAQIYADFDTTLGPFTVELDYTSSPRTVANFIGLATGNKTWLDTNSGEVKTNTPFFTNRLFHRIWQGDFIQGGSVSSEGAGGPGYRFPEEQATTDFTDPYLLAMANAGPQTNSAGFFITVASVPGFNGNYTVFGSVPEDDDVGEDEGQVIDGSRDVVNAINNVPLVPTTGRDQTPVTDINTNSVTIRRFGAAAIAFDETAYDLPIISPQPVTFNFPSPTTTDTILTFPQAPGTSFLINTTDNLASWRTQERYIDPDAPASLTEFNIGALQANKARQFYSPSALVTWPSDATFPDSFANRTLVALTAFDPVNDFTFNFDATGVTGTWSYSNPGLPLSGIIIDSLLLPDGYGCRLIMILSGINFNRWDFDRIGFDTTTTTLFNCRQSGEATITSNDEALPLNLSGTSKLTR